MRIHTLDKEPTPYGTDRQPPFPPHRWQEHQPASEAMEVYGIRRLASRITDLKAAGYDIDTVIKNDEAGHRYARYSMVLRDRNGKRKKAA